MTAEGKKSDKKEIQAPTQLFVTKQFKVGKAEGAAQGTDEVLAVHRFETEPARVSVELGLTLNMGNYESARLSVAVVVPCYKEEVDSAFDYAKKWVSDRVSIEKEKILAKDDTSII